MTTIKLTDTSLFDDLVSNRKSTKSVKDFDLKQYEAWFNHFKPNTKQSNILWVVKYKQKIYDKYYNASDILDSTRRIHLESLARILLLIDKNKYRDFARDVFRYTLELQKEKDNQQNEGLMKQNELENFVCFTQLEEIADDLLQEFIKKTELKTQSDDRLHMRTLIIGVNTYYPPLRMDWVGMEFYEGAKAPPVNKTNYLWRHNGIYKIVINYDKIEHKRLKKNLAREIFDIPKNVPYINHDNFYLLMDHSFDLHPRKYVLISTTANDEPMSRNSYYSHIKTALKDEGKVPRQNLLRKIFINHFHRDALYPKKLNRTQKLDLARRQRHTLATTELNYEKMEAYDLCEGYYAKEERKGKEKGNSDDIKKEIKQEVEVKQEIVKKAAFNLKEWNKSYYAENREDIRAKAKERYKQDKYNILRRKIIKNLNSGQVSRPKQSTIDEYDLKEVGDNKWE